MRGTLLWLAIGALASEPHAAPYLPAEDSAVLERLPTRRDDPQAAQLRRLRADVAAAPADSDKAATLAKRYFEMAGAEGDPRYIGYAEAALRPWRGDDAPTEVLFTRGLLSQYRHDFDSALQDFARALQRDPQHFGARAWRAAIFMVRADYTAAARECALLGVHTDDLYAAGCSAYVEAATGKLRPAYERLSAALGASPGADPAVKLWTLTRLAEMAWRLGDHGAAERLFKQALALGQDDNFLLAAYADFLLEQGRPKEVVGLLDKWVRSDTLLLRLALAENALKHPAAKAHVQALADRFAAAVLRGERLHMGEEARFLLDLKGDRRAALAVALENWKAQREPRDALIVLEAAAAARDAKAAVPVLRWLEENRFESERLQRLAASLK